jgi:hypothetical protein
MPLKWEKGKNPYLHNYFCILEIGPNTPVAQIAQRAKSLVQRVEQGFFHEIDGQSVDQHKISEAGSRLTDDRSRAPELLLMHPELKHDRRELTIIESKLANLAQIPATHEPLPLRHPLGIFWFVPQPDEKAADWPHWHDFHLTEPGDPDDLDLDVIFDS